MKVGYPDSAGRPPEIFLQWLEVVLDADNPARPLLHPLADRIAINREVMGLHYRSDSEAGKRLADNITKLVDDIAREKEAGERPFLYDTLKAAWLEWHPNQDFDPAWERTRAAASTEQPATV
jgi:hypothetical protein